MIDKKNIERYFLLMKSKGFIAEYWNFDCSTEDGDYLKIFFVHKSGKRSSYRFLKNQIHIELRNDKLNKLFD